MEILIAIISIVSITGAVYTGRKFWLKVCPICAGVFLSWVWMIFLAFLGYIGNEYILIAGILMGGSIVGISTKIAESFKRDVLIFKVIFIPLGFMSSYLFLKFNWIPGVVGLVGMIATALIFISRNKNGEKIDSNERTQTTLQERLKNCCK